LAIPFRGTDVEGTEEWEGSEDGFRKPLNVSPAIVRKFEFRDLFGVRRKQH